jgi:hypothetical protein
MERCVLACENSSISRTVIALRLHQVGLYQPDEKGEEEMAKAA